MSTVQTRVTFFRSGDDFDQKAAEKIIRLLKESMSGRRKFSIALSGGETPRGVYRQLASISPKHHVDWSRVHLFFSDERAVPAKDPQSNFGMIDRELISQIKIPKENIHRIKGELDPQKAATEYQKDLRATLRGKGNRLDLVLLGLGADGHTASLFPGAVDVGKRGALVAPVEVNGTHGSRVTLTLRCINNARTIVFLVTGSKKSSIVQRVLHAKNPTKDLPASFVSPNDGSLLWVLDEEAGASLASDGDAG